MNIVARGIEIKMMLEKFGDEMENVFEKTQFLCVTTYFFEENVEKQPFFRMTTYFSEENVNKKHFFRMTTYFFEKEC